MPSLNLQILIAACLGVTIGWLTGTLPADAPVREGVLYASTLLGSIFIGLLKMVLIPLIFTSIVVGVANLQAHHQVNLPTPRSHLLAHRLRWFLQTLPGRQPPQPTCPRTILPLLVRSSTRRAGCLRSCVAIITRRSRSFTMTRVSQTLVLSRKPRLLMVRRPRVETALALPRAPYPRGRATLSPWLPVLRPCQKLTSITISETARVGNAKPPPPLLPRMPPLPYRKRRRCRCPKSTESGGACWVLVLEARCVLSRPPARTAARRSP